MIAVLLLSAVLSTVAAPTPPLLPADLDDPAALARALRQQRRQGQPRAGLDLLAERGPELLQDERVLGEAVQAWLALGELTRARELAARARPGPRARALPLATALTELLLRAGDLDGARQNLAALRQAKPDHPDLRCLAARLAVLEGEYVDAGRHLEALADELAPAVLDELSADLAVARATELLAMDEFVERAIDLLEPALAATPHRADVRGLLARALGRWQRVDQAEALLDEGLALDDEAARVPLLFARGLLLRNALREAEAQECLGEVLARDPGHVRARLVLASCHLERGELDQAASLLGAALRNAPRDLEALMLLADLESARGDWDRAAAALEQLLEVKPRHLKGLWMLSRVRARQRRVDDVALLMDRYEARLSVLADRR